MTDNLLKASFLSSCTRNNKLPSNENMHNRASSYYEFEHYMDSMSNMYTDTKSSGQEKINPKKKVIHEHGS